MPPDQPRPAATGPDSDFTLTIEDTAQLYTNAGHPRTLRTIQRYCASGHLDCMKAATTLGDKYFVSSQSVARHIAQIEELVALQNRASGLDMSRHVASVVQPQSPSEISRHTTTAFQVSPPVAPASESPPQAIANEDVQRQTTTPKQEPSRPDATPEPVASRYVAQLEREVERLNDDRDFLRGQIKVKDEQIANLSTRFSETQRLVAGLQRMMAPLLGQADPYRVPEDADDNRATQ